MDKSQRDDLRTVLDYAQPDEEHDWNYNPSNDHIVYAMRRLRAWLNQAQERVASTGDDGTVTRVVGGSLVYDDGTTDPLDEPE